MPINGRRDLIRRLKFKYHVMTSWRYQRVEVYLRTFLNSIKDVCGYEVERSVRLAYRTLCISVGNRNRISGLRRGILVSILTSKMAIKMMTIIIIIIIIIIICI